MEKNKLIFWPLAFLLFLGGCTGGNSGGTGTLKVSLTDLPSCGFDEVNVTVSKVRVHESNTVGGDDSGWRDITLSPPRKINLTSLVNGVLEDLGQTTLPAGHYTQLRLVLVPNSPTEPLNNSVLPAGGSGSETAIDTPSAVQSGIKLIHEFDVEANTLVDLVLDFDACKSIVTKGDGKYALKPVIHVIPMDVSGTIAGFVDPALADDNPMVFAEQGGEVVKSTVPDENGSFTLSPLQQSATAGDYDVVITADNHATAMITSVPVTTGGTTTVASSANPINLNSSSTHTVSGTVTPESAEALIRVSQTFSSGPAMEVRSNSADLTDGTYSLTLPAEAPLLGSYEATLPITLTADLSIAGVYDLEASAEGFTSQETSVDVSSTDVTHDFTLTTVP